MTPLPDRRLPSPLDYGKIIVDIGSGARPYGNIQLDIYPDRSDQHHRGETVEPTIIGDAHHLPLKDKVVHRILYLHILEHLKCPYYALLEAYRVLRGFGEIRVELPNPRLWEHERDEHLYSWHPDTFRNIVRETGFDTKLYHQGGRNHSVEAIK